MTGAIAGTGIPSSFKAAIPMPDIMRLSTDATLLAARALDIPVLLVRGRQSELVSEEHVREFLEYVPHAKYADVSEAGHMVAGDRNDLFSDAVLAFLDDL